MEDSTSTLIESRRRLLERLSKPSAYPRVFPVLPKPTPSEAPNLEQRERESELAFRR